MNANGCGKCQLTAAHLGSGPVVFASQFGVEIGIQKPPERAAVQLFDQPMHQRVEKGVEAVAEFGIGPVHGLEMAAEGVAEILIVKGIVQIGGHDMSFQRWRIETGPSSPISTPSKFRMRSSLSAVRMRAPVVTKRPIS